MIKQARANSSILLALALLLTLTLVLADNDTNLTTNDTLDEILTEEIVPEEETPQKETEPKDIMPELEIKDSEEVEVINYVIIEDIETEEIVKKADETTFIEEGNYKVEINNKD